MGIIDLVREQGHLFYSIFHTTMEPDGEQGLEEEVPFDLFENPLWEAERVIRFRSTVSRQLRYSERLETAGVYDREWPDPYR